jgi:hypothetical protein
MKHGQQKDKQANTEIKEEECLKKLDFLIHFKNHKQGEKNGKNR